MEFAAFTEFVEFAESTEFAEFTEFVLRHHTYSPHTRLGMYMRKNLLKVEWDTGLIPCLKPFKDEKLGLKESLCTNYYTCTNEAVWGDMGLETLKSRRDRAKL